MDNINRLIDEVINGLAVGVVDAEIKFKMKINPKTSNHFEITPTLNIKDKDKFYKYINEYISLFFDDTSYILAESKDDYIKRIIAILFANMSLNDFNNPCEYVRRIINFKKEQFFENKIKILVAKAFKEAEEKGFTREKRKEYYLEQVNKQRYYQSNMTEKFIRTFYRLAYHFNNINITSLPMELDDGLHIRLGKFKTTNNEILNDVIQSSNNKAL